MDKIGLLQKRRTRVLEAEHGIRQTLSAIVDADSFVELSGFSFSKNDFYDEEAAGEGVVTGFATVDGYPVYVAAQNFAVLHGGVSRENCAKIVRCLELAEKNSTPVLYILHSLGVQIGEGVTVLEGLAAVLAKAAALRGVVPQFAVVEGEVYGQAALLAACADFTYFLKGGVLAADSPLVIAAKSGKNLPKEEVGGAAALAGSNLVSFTPKNLAEVRGSIRDILGLLPEYSASVEEDGSDLNKAFPQLNKKCSGDALIAAVFDGGKPVEFGASCAPDVRCLLGRIGGIAAAAVVFDGDEGVLLDAQKVMKVTSLVKFAAYYDLPFVTFVNARGVRSDMETANSPVMRCIADLVESYGLIDNAKVAVVYKEAVGLGYTLFAAKSMGFDYVYAFADAKIALFSGAAGAEIEFAAETKADKAKLAAKYAEENSDPVHAAKNGYVDNIIEPQFVRQYLIASLQMLLK